MSTMPELPEVHRAERACNAKLVGKKIVHVESFKDQEIFQYRKPSKDDPKVWPPRFWKFTITLMELSNSSSQNIVMAFTDMRRLARIRLVNSPLQDLPILKLGFDPLQGMPERQTFKEKILRRRCPIKALLLDQSFSAGVGNWIADETLYQSRIHPAQYANTLSDEQITALYENLIYVCQTAAEANADSSLFPSSWLFHYRWGKGKKAGAFMPDGEKILFDTVGGRTTAIVPSVQILIQNAPRNDSSYKSTNLAKRRKRITIVEILQSENSTKVSSPKLLLQIRMSRFPAQYEQWSTQQQWSYQQQQPTQYYQQQQQSFHQQQHSYQQPQYLSESQTNYEYMDYTQTPYDGHTTYTDVSYAFPNNSITANMQQTSYDYITPHQILRQPLHQLQMPQQQIPSEVTMFPTQILPQTRERQDLQEQQLISQYPQQQESQLLPHKLLWYFAERYLSKAKATELSSTSSVNHQKLSSEQQKHILAAIKLSQILFWFTENVREAEKLYNAEGDFNGCLSTLKQAESMADQRGDIEMKACLLISIVQYAFTNQNYSIAQHSLAELSTLYFPPPSSRPPQTYHIFPISNHRLHLHYLLLYVAFNMHTGNVKDATEKLAEVHNMLNQKRDVESLDDVKGYTTIHVSAAPTSSTTMTSYSTSTAKSVPVRIKVSSKAEIYTLTFLISRICNGNATNV
ncbi:6873_t:CDS:2, partial [Racocetra fulgida]